MAKQYTMVIDLQRCVGCHAVKIDIHAHFYPQEYLEEISRLGAASTDPFTRGWYGQMASPSTGQRSGALTNR